MRTFPNVFCLPKDSSRGVPSDTLGQTQAHDGPTEGGLPKQLKNLWRRGRAHCLPRRVPQQSILFLPVLLRVVYLIDRAGDDLPAESRKIW